MASARFGASLALILDSIHSRTGMSSYHTILSCETHHYSLTVEYHACVFPSVSALSLLIVGYGCTLQLFCSKVLPHPYCYKIRAIYARNRAGGVNRTRTTHTCMSMNTKCLRTFWLKLLV